MPGRTRPIDTFAAAAAKCSAEVCIPLLTYNLHINNLSVNGFRKTSGDTKRF